MVVFVPTAKDVPKSKLCFSNNIIQFYVIHSLKILLCFVTSLKTFKIL